MKKLQDDRGISMVIAVVVFLIAAVISGLIITASLSSMKRVTQSKQSLQGGLTVDSAANLVRADLAGMEYVISVSEAAEEGTSAKTDNRSELTAMLGVKMAQAISEMEENAVATATGSFTVSVSDNSVSVVNGAFSVARTGSDAIPYEFRFTLQNADTKECVYLTFAVRCQRETREGADGKRANVATFTFLEPTVSNRAE